MCAVFLYSIYFFFSCSFKQSVPEIIFLKSFLGTLQLLLFCRGGGIPPKSVTFLTKRQVFFGTKLTINSNLSTFLALFDSFSTSFGTKTPFSAILVGMFADHSRGLSTRSGRGVAWRHIHFRNFFRTNNYPPMKAHHCIRLLVNSKMTPFAVGHSLVSCPAISSCSWWW